MQAMISRQRREKMGKEALQDMEKQLVSVVYKQVCSRVVYTVSYGS